MEKRQRHATSSGLTRTDDKKQQQQQQRLQRRESSIKEKGKWRVIFLPLVPLLIMLRPYFDRSPNKPLLEGMKSVDSIMVSDSSGDSSGNRVSGDSNSSSSTGSTGSSNSSTNDNDYYNVDPDDYKKALHRLDRFEPLRGVRYLYEHYDLLLVVLPKAGNTDPVRIINVNKNISAFKGLDYCSSIPPLTIWVRIAGPEIVAGLATKTEKKTAAAARTKNSECAWEYHHEPLSPGNYTIDVKVLSVNDDGGDVLTDKQCHFQESHSIMGGSKLLEFRGAEDQYHYPNDACCNLCTKTPLCTHFISTNNYNESTRRAYGPHCILYSNSTTTTRTELKLQQQKQWQQLQIIPTTNGTSAEQMFVVGTSRKDKTGATMFLGCGYSITLEMNFCKGMGWDDVPYMIRNSFFVSSLTDGVDVANSSTDEPNSTRNATQESLPICPGTLEGVSYGRWVKLLHSPPSSEHCIMEIFTTFPFPQYHHNDSQPEQCWVQDKLMGNRCNNGCIRNPKSNLWKSHLITERKNIGESQGSEFFDYTWQPYNCHLPLYTTDALAQCFQKYNYSTPELRGDSITRYFSSYLNHRMKQLDKTLKGVRPRKTRVILDNYRIVHHAWHDSNEQFQETLREWSKKEKDEPFPAATKKIWITPPFISSERATHVTHGRVQEFRNAARPFLVEELGWKELDFVNISIALSFESSILYDGLHVVGSPMKTMFHMIMHAICAE